MGDRAATGAIYYATFEIGPGHPMVSLLITARRETDLLKQTDLRTPLLRHAGWLSHTLQVGFLPDPGGLMRTSSIEGCAPSLHRVSYSLNNVAREYIDAQVRHHFSAAAAHRSLVRIWMLFCHRSAPTLSVFLSSANPCLCSDLLT